MKFYQKKRIIQELWAHISLAINCAITTFMLAGNERGLLVSGLLLAVAIICHGVLKIHRGKFRKGDFSGVSVVIQYICVFVITFTVAIRLEDHLPLIPLLVALSIASFAELLVVLIITYWWSAKANI